MTAQTLLILLLVLACPLMMVFMMRGHGGHAHGHGAEADDTSQPCASLDELRERRSELDAQIQALEDQYGDRFTAAR